MLLEHVYAYNGAQARPPTEKQGVAVTPYRRAPGVHYLANVCLIPSECGQFGRSDTNATRRDAKTQCLSCALHRGQRAFRPSLHHGSHFIVVLIAITTVLDRQVWLSLCTAAGPLSPTACASWNIDKQVQQSNAIAIASLFYSI